MRRRPRHAHITPRLPHTRTVTDLTLSEDHIDAILTAHSRVVCKKAKHIAYKSSKRFGHSATPAANPHARDLSAARARRGAIIRSTVRPVLPAARRPLGLPELGNDAVRRRPASCGSAVRGRAHSVVGELGAIRKDDRRCAQSEQDAQLTGCVRRLSSNHPTAPASITHTLPAAHHTLDLGQPSLHARLHRGPYPSVSSLPMPRSPGVMDSPSHLEASTSPTPPRLLTTTEPCSVVLQALLARDVGELWWLRSPASSKERSVLAIENAASGWTVTQSRPRTVHAMYDPRTAQGGRQVLERDDGSSGHNRDDEGMFPHLYNGPKIGKAQIESVRLFKRAGETWDLAQVPEAQGWLV